MSRKSKTLDIMNGTVPFVGCHFSRQQVGQFARGLTLGIEHVSGWHYIAASMTDSIPVHVKQALAQAGWNVLCLGGTSYVYSLLAGRKIPASRGVCGA